MRKLVIGDLHYGIKSNSISWLETQLEFFNTQIFETIKTENIDTVIFLGDVSDIRYSINQQVGIEVKKAFRNMLNEYPDKQFVIVAGNHDFYSPLEEFADYNFYELVFGEEFYNVHKNLKVITVDPWLDEEGSLYLPWYWTENTDHFDAILYQYDFAQEVKSVYCHADLGCWPGARIGSLKGCPVYSGHIHNINNDRLTNLYNLGAALPLNFNDVNQDRYLYVIENHKIVKTIKNTTTPQFLRFYDEEKFDLSDDTFDNTYIELCISNTNMSKAKYIERIKYLKLNYINSNIRVHIIDTDTNIATLNVEGFNTDIHKYISKNIPKHLDTKYEKIKNKISAK